MESSNDKTSGVSNSVTFDDALSLTKFGQLNYVLIIIAGTILTAFLLETLGISYVIAVAECDLQLSTKEKGVLSGIAFVGVIISSHLWGFLADTMGRRKVIVPTLCLTFGTTALSSFATGFWSIVILRFFAGFFVSGSSATIYAYLGEFHNHRNRSRAIMGASFVFGIGCLLLPAIAYVVINREWALVVPVLNIVYRPWRLFLVVCSLPCLVSGLALLWLPESPKFMLHQGDMKAAIDTIQWMHRVNCGKTVSPLFIDLILADEEDKQFEERRAVLSSSKGFSAMMKLVWDQTAPLFRKPYLNITAIVCFLQFGTYFTSHGLYMFFPEILNQLVESHAAGVDRTTVCNVVYTQNRLINSEVVGDQSCTPQMLNATTYGLSFILEVIYALGFAVIGVLINVVGKLSILVFVFVGCGLSGALMVVVDTPVGGMSLYMILVMAGFGGSVVTAATVDLFPTNLRAMAVCIALMFGRLGGVVGANMLGMLLDTHCEWSFGMSGAILMICTVLSFFIPNINVCTRGNEPLPTLSSKPESCDEVGYVTRKSHPTCESVENIQ
ncbi:synaptic vesicle glycoprotein 2B-like [Topomyia yanbarensis]|uniref:synaptic vesicle glycoprotein 2B-like n=1 Tax=Topomyia yanbarensis TaxID=2498891 RepID=UPI00273C1788|nr:synaptic vesicle glycoprotein 2B-like [Topomyia yanbarensis]XP_058839999.1 synaptic vesicle glycoprotein 2B-like [Topomyia yanbarensis]